MTTISRRFGATIGSMALLSLGGVAYGQENADSAGTEISASPTYRVGDGFKLSDDFVLHPRVELEGGYQTNVFYADDTDEGGQQGSPLMRVGVGAGLTTNGDHTTAPRLVLTGDVQVLWNQYLSGDDDISDRSDMGINAMAEAQINPQGAVGFTLSDSFVRQVNPPPAEFAEDADRDKNSLLGKLSLRPGGGALEIYASAGWDIDLYESEVFTFAQRNTVNFAAGTKWQWLPKTQVNGEVSLALIFVDENAVRVDKNTATPLRVTAGISTLVTPNFGTVLKLGYGNSFQSGASFNSYIALAELRYAFGPMVKVAAGYSHDFADSVIGNVRVDHTVFARFVGLIAGQLQLSLRGEVRFRDYLGVPTIDDNGITYCGNTSCTTPDRSDVILRFTPAAEYQVNEWLTFGAHYSLISDTTDAFVMRDGLSDSFGFVWNEFMVTAQAKF